MKPTAIPLESHWNPTDIPLKLHTYTKKIYSTKPGGGTEGGTPGETLHPTSRDSNASRITSFD